MTDQVNADWTELQVTIPAADTDRAGDIAQMVVPYGIYIEDYSHLEEEAMEIAHIDLIDEDLLKKDRTKSIIHVYISPEENPFLSSKSVLKPSALRTPSPPPTVRRRIGSTTGKSILSPSPSATACLCAPCGRTSTKQVTASCCIWSRVSRSVPARMKRPAFAWSCSKSM